MGAALAESGLPRSDVFLTSKLHPRHHGYESALHQFEQSLGDLRTSYLDLFLLHYPRCWPGLCAAPQGTWQDSWRALEALLQAGKVRAIGARLPAPPLPSERVIERELVRERRKRRRDCAPKGG